MNPQTEQNSAPDQNPAQLGQQKEPIVPLPPSKSKLPLLLTFIFLVILILVGGYKLMSNSPPPPPQPNPTQSPTISTDPTANWEIYTSKELNISFKYSPELVVSENYTKGTGLYDEGIEMHFNQFGGFPNRWMKITNTQKSDYWNNDRISSLYGTPIGEQYNESNENFLGTFTRLPDTQIGDKTAHVFESKNVWETPPPLKRFVIKDFDNYYLIDITYSNIENLTITPQPYETFDYISTFNQILSTFTFLNNE